MAKLHPQLLLLVITLLVAFVAAAATSSVAAVLATPTSQQLMNTTTTTVEAAAPAAATVYDVLEKNNLPRGLLPKGVVESYTLTPQGKLDVTLRDACEYPFFTFDDGAVYYTVRFGDRVGGIITSGSVQETHGVGVQIGYGWLGVSGINRSGNRIMVSLQQSKPLSFPVSRFAVSPSCT